MRWLGLGSVALLVLLAGACGGSTKHVVASSGTTSTTTTSATPVSNGNVGLPAQQVGTLPAGATTSTPASTTPSTSPIRLSLPPPKIDSFSVSPTHLVCSIGSSTPITIVVQYRVEGAGSADGDIALASNDPGRELYYQSFPSQNLGYPVPCNGMQYSFTLTVKSDTGDTATRTVTVIETYRSKLGG